MPANADTPEIKMRKSIIVGLGGSGILAAQYIKRALIQYYGELPYSVKFICLDTDSRRPLPLRVSIGGKRFQRVDIDHQEFFSLAVQDPLNVLNISPEIKEWWPKNIPTKAILLGAGGYRALGRLAFFAHAYNMKDIITNLVQQLQSVNLSHEMRKAQNIELVGDHVHVFVIGSLAGGTGSGCFIDAGFLLKHTLRGIPNLIGGYFILPAAFVGLPATSRVEMNGYAALKELEYYTNFDYTKQQLSFKYGDEDCRIDRPPYDVVNLIDSTLESGLTIPAHGPKRVEILCRIIGEGIALNMGDIGAALLSQMDNLYAHITAQLTDYQAWGGKKPHYSSIGVSSIIYPMEKHFNKVSTNYAYTLIEQLSGQLKNVNHLTNVEVELENQVEKFLTESSLHKDALLELLQPGENLNIRLSYDDLRSNDDLIAEEENGQRIRDSVIKNISENATKILKKTLNSTREFFTKIEQKDGVISARKAAEKFVARFTFFNDQIIEQLKKLTTDEIPAALSKKEDYYKEEVQNAGLIVKVFRKIYQIYSEYLDYVKDLYKKELEKERHQKANNIYNELCNLTNNYLEGMNLNKIEQKLSHVRTDIESEYFGTSQLPEHYGQHSLILSAKEIVLKADTNDPKMVSWDKQIINLRTDFKILNIQPPEVNDFFTQSKLHMRDIENIEVNELHKVIMQYVHEKVKPIKNMNIIDILSNKKISGFDFDYWLKELSQRSVPLWNHKIREGNLAARIEELFIIGSEKLIPLLNEKDRRFFNTRHDPTFMATSDPYKIFIFKYKAPAPAYQLKGMDRYRAVYLNATISGTPHTQEGFELNSEDVFPEDSQYKNTLKVVTLCLAANIIKHDLSLSRYVINEPSCLKPGQDQIELNRSAWEVFEDLKRDGQEELVNSLLESCKTRISNDSDQLKQNLLVYYDNLKKEFTRKDAAMCLGQELFIHQQIKLIDLYRKSNKLDIFVTME